MVFFHKTDCMKSVQKSVKYFDDVAIHGIQIKSLRIN